jgi:hypothetical protein
MSIYGARQRSLKLLCVEKKRYLLIGKTAWNSMSVIKRDENKMKVAAFNGSRTSTTDVIYLILA